MPATTTVLPVPGRVVPGSQGAAKTCFDINEQLISLLDPKQRVSTL